MQASLCSPSPVPLPPCPPTHWSKASSDWLVQLSPCPHPCLPPSPPLSPCAGTGCPWLGGAPPSHTAHIMLPCPITALPSWLLPWTPQPFHIGEDKVEDLPSVQVSLPAALQHRGESWPLSPRTCRSPSTSQTPPATSSLTSFLARHPCFLEREVQEQPHRSLPTPTLHSSHSGASRHLPCTQGVLTTY